MREPAKPTVDSAHETRHRLFWLGFIVALLAGQIVLMLVLVYLGDVGRVVRHRAGLLSEGPATGTRWRRKLGRTTRLGWSAKIELGPDVSVRGSGR